MFGGTVTLLGGIAFLPISPLAPVFFGLAIDG
jgi:hypothetical protein